MTVEIDFDKIAEDATSLLVKMIQNKCVNHAEADSGNEIRSVNTLIDYFTSYGISDYEVFEPHEGRGNLLIKVEGTDPNASSLMYQSHLDVVPANPDGWDVDPFEGIIKDGFVWGRGALDMLIFTATQATAFAHLISSGWKPTGDFYFLAVADEEAGGDYGAKWLVENVPDKVNADYMIGEMGGAAIETGDGLKAGVMTAEKGPAWSRIHVKGKPGHGSIPYGTDNALLTMNTILTKIENNPPKPMITDAWRTMVKELSPGKISEFLLTHRSTVNLAMKIAKRQDLGMAKTLHALSRMTVTPTIADAGSKTNIIPDTATLEFDIRILPGQDWGYVKNYFKDTLGSKLWNQINFEQIQYDPGSSDPWDVDLIDSIGKTYADVVPGGKIMPLFLPGVTDARFFRQLGVKCYGFCVLTDAIDTTLLADLFHGNNERVPEIAIEKSTEFFVKLATDFLGRETK